MRLPVCLSGSSQTCFPPLLCCSLRPASVLLAKKCITIALKIRQNVLIEIVEISDYSRCQEKNSRSGHRLRLHVCTCTAPENLGRLPAMSFYLSRRDSKSQTAAAACILVSCLHPSPIPCFKSHSYVDSVRRGTLPSRFPASDFVRPDPHFN